MTIAGRTLAALLAVLGRPSWWMLGLAGFLVRGGIVVFLVAIITLPSPLALSHGHDQRNGEPWVLALLAAPLDVYRHARRLNMKKPPGDCAAWAASSIDQARL